jgi:tight adherence protein B
LNADGSVVVLFEIWWQQELDLTEFVGFLVNSWEFFSLLALAGLGFFLFLLVFGWFKERNLRKSSQAVITREFGAEKNPKFPLFLGQLTRWDSAVSRSMQKGPGSGLVRAWLESGWGQGVLDLFGLLVGITLAGFFLVFSLSGRILLGLFVSAALAGGLMVGISYRAAFQRRRIEDQFPDLVERLADSLQAGYTLPQAVHFIGPNLLEPSSTEMIRVSRKIKIGVSPSAALLELYQKHPFEDLKLLIEILKLHQKVGGDIVKMIRELAAVVRERIELEKDVRSLTAQGRLSALVITLLVPVSLVILAFFPGYIEVLFQTTAGNLVLMTAVILDGIGALIVRRLIRVEV